MTPHPNDSARQGWMRILALSEWPDLQSASQGLLDVEHWMLRPPECGLVMVRGRMGGSGAPYNAGEATVVRLSWPFDDPASFQGSHGAKLEQMRAVRDAIEAKIREWCESVCAVPAKST